MEEEKEEEEKEKEEEKKEEEKEDKEEEGEKEESVCPKQADFYHFTQQKQFKHSVVVYLR